jgi:hypothetical protein
VNKIILASTILRQQLEINFSASDIAQLHLTPSELYDAVAMMVSDPTVVAVPTAHSSNVNVMTTKEPPSFHGVITTSDALQLVLGTEHINLRSLFDKAAISTIDMHLSARGTLCGFKKPTDYERWIDWDHRRFSKFMTILFGDAQTKLDKSTNLHSSIIKFDFGFRDWNHLGDIRDTVKEQRVLSELAELIDNDIDPSNETESGLQELVKLIH